jgi:hypothetical protein
MPNNRQMGRLLSKFGGRRFAYGVSAADRGHLEVAGPMTICLSQSRSSDSETYGGHLFLVGHSCFLS